MPQNDRSLIPIFLFVVALHLSLLLLPEYLSDSKPLPKPKERLVVKTIPLNENREIVSPIKIAPEPVAELEPTPPQVMVSEPIAIGEPLPVPVLIEPGQESKKTETTPKPEPQPEPVKPEHEIPKESKPEPEIESKKEASPERPLETEVAPKSIPKEESKPKIKPQAKKEPTKKATPATKKIVKKLESPPKKDKKKQPLAKKPDIAKKKETKLQKKKEVEKSAPKAKPKKEEAKTAKKSEEGQKKPKVDPAVIAAQEAAKTKRRDLLASAQKSIAKIEPTHDKLGASQISLESVPKVPRSIDSLQIEAILGEKKGELTSQEIGYHEELARRLKLLLRLPEFGEVKIKLTLERSGQFVKVVIISTESDSNRQYIEKSLPKLKYPSFGNNFTDKEQYTFVIALSNE